MIRCSAATDSGPDGHPAEPGVVDRKDEPGPRRAGAQRDDDSKGYVCEAADGEFERSGSRRIEPLRVIHGEQDGPLSRASSRRIERTAVPTRRRLGARPASARRSATSIALR